MALLGSFGDVVFEAGTSGGMPKVRTWSQFKRKGDARLAIHEVLQGKPKSEFQGAGLEEIDLRVRFDVALGLVPIDEVNTLRVIRDGGQEHHLIIAGKPLGKFVLFAIDEEWLATDNAGNLLSADLNLKLREYH